MVPVNSIIRFLVMISTRRPLGLARSPSPAMLGVLAFSVSLDRALLALARPRARRRAHLFVITDPAAVLASRPTSTGATSIVSDPIRAPEPTFVACFSYPS